MDGIKVMKCSLWAGIIINILVFIVGIILIINNYMPLWFAIGWIIVAVLLWSCIMLAELGVGGKIYEK